jgi:CDP-diacylglycerol--glycerol-3-phosphate 3-phosphatidyltransferase
MRRVDVDTFFWPVIQAGVLGIKEEEAALGKVWHAVREAHRVEDERVAVDLTSGYFGLYKTYKKAVLDSPAPYRVITASPKVSLKLLDVFQADPQANGFFGSAGLSRLIPEGYSFLERKFWYDAKARGRGYQSKLGLGVRLKEWEREGWTYHAKGW